MFTILKSMFNNGENDGDVILRTINKDMRCHSFVAKYNSELIKEQLDNCYFPGVVMIDYNSNLVNIVFNYFYSEKIIDIDLTGEEIISLFGLINQLRCQITINTLKNHYVKKFPKTLNDNNWLDLLKLVYGISKYSDLQEEVLSYFLNNILSNVESLECFMLSEYYKYTDEYIRDKLFQICLQRIIYITNEIQSYTQETQVKNDTKKTLNNYIKNIGCESDEEQDSETEEPMVVTEKMKKTNSSIGSKSKRK